MAKQSRSKGKSVRNHMKRHARPGRSRESDVVIDINAFTSHHERHRAESCSHPLIQARNQAQGQYLAAIRTNQLVSGLGPAEHMEITESCRAGVPAALPAETTCASHPSALFHAESAWLPSWRVNGCRFRRVFLRLFSARDRYEYLKSCF